MDRERKLKGQQALYQYDDSLRKMDKIEHIHNQKDNMSNPGMGQESSPAQDDHKLAPHDLDARSPFSTTRQEIEHRKRCLLP
jgi:hypothetical protein